jgi:crossover junction endodeoxyribonuclease RuvC
MIFSWYPIYTMKKSQIIIGIDPGYGRVGWGVIQKQGSILRHIAHGCIETSPKKEFIERLEGIYTELNIIVQKYSPDISGVEELFFYKNVTTGIDVGQARGVILLTLRQAKLKVYEYTPLQVKQAVVGYGKAEKKQVQKMVQMILGMKTIPKQDDAADALAVAILASSER